MQELHNRNEGRTLQPATLNPSLTDNLERKEHLKMTNIKDFLAAMRGPEVLESIAKAIPEGATTQQAETAVTTGLPILLTALREKASDPDIASEIVKGIGKFTPKGESSPAQAAAIPVSEEDKKEAEGFLGKLFGDKMEPILSTISSATGWNSKGALSSLAMMLCKLFGFMGNNGKAEGLSGTIGQLIDQIQQGKDNKILSGLGLAASLFSGGEKKDDDNGILGAMDGLIGSQIRKKFKF